MKKVIFLTGATGLVGRNLILRILKGDPETKLILLVRGNSDSMVEQRIDEMLWALTPEIDVNQARNRIQVIRGDITFNKLGLSEPLYHRLATEVTHIIHSAATVQFQLPWECARIVNCTGTRNVMAFAKCAQETGKVQRIAYISTAYVCGNRSGTIRENELDFRQQFSNTYEQTKFESEQFVRKLMQELPITIFRPSVIVGDSKTGKTTAFNVLYIPWKLIYRGVLKVLPGSRYTPLDVVPVDFVSDAIYHIFLKTNQGIGKTYHLTSGKEKAVTAGEIVDLAVDYFNKITVNKKTLRIKFFPLRQGSMDKLFLSNHVKRELKKMKVYEPYLCVYRTFDNTNTYFALRGTGITSPRFKKYYKTLLRYCIETDWGKQIKCAA